MPPLYHPARVVGNLAALVLLALGVAFLVDHIAGWLGWHFHAFCSTVGFFMPLTFVTGVILCTLGILIWAATWFKGQAGIGLIVGGGLVAFLPGVMPHYLAVQCPMLS